MKISLRKFFLSVSALAFLMLSGQIETFAVQGLQNSDVPPVAPSFTLVFENETLRAEIKNAPLYEVLRELAWQTNLPIEVSGSIADEKVSVLFDSLPFEDGLHAILRHKNYILLYSSVTGSHVAYAVEGVKIAGKGESPPFIIGNGYRYERPEPLSPPRSEYIPVANEPVKEGFHEQGVYGGSLAQAQNNVSDTTQIPRVDTRGPNKGNVTPFGIQPGQGSTVTTPDRVPRSKQPSDEQIADMEDIASDQGLEAIPYLEQVARSNPDLSVREHAQMLIGEIREEAETADESGYKHFD